MHANWNSKEERWWIQDGKEIIWFDTFVEADAGARTLHAKNSIEAEVSLIAQYFRKLGKTQVAMAIENGDYKNEE